MPRPVDTDNYNDLDAVFAIATYDEKTHLKAAKTDVDDHFALLQAIWKGGPERLATRVSTPTPGQTTRYNAYDSDHKKHRAIGKKAKIKRVLRFSNYPLMVLLNLIVHSLLAWLAFGWGASVDAGDIVFSEYDPRSIIQNFGAVRFLLVLGPLLWVGSLVIFFIVRYILLLGTVDEINRTIRHYFEVLETTWFADMRSLLALLGSGERGAKREATATNVYHVTQVWRRVERLAARIPILWADFKDISTDNASRRPKWAVFWIVLLTLISASFNWNLIYAQIINNAVPWQVYEPLIRNLIMLTLATFGTNFLVWWWMYWRSKNIIETLDKVIKFTPDGSSREESIAALDPSAALIEHYRGDLDDVLKLR